MSNCYYHAESSARKHGGVWQDYIDLHMFFDMPKLHLGDNRHRAVFHNTFGIQVAEMIFGAAIKRKSDGVEVPTRILAEQHIHEDVGKILTLKETLAGLPMEQWMLRAADPLSRRYQQQAPDQEPSKENAP